MSGEPELERTFRLNVQDGSLQQVSTPDKASESPNRRSEPVVVYAGDQNVVIGIAVSLASLLQSHSNASVVVLAADWTAKQLAWFRGQFVGFKVHVQAADANRFPSGTDHITSATFLRLTIPAVVPGDGHVLYLDSDTLVRRELLGDLSSIATRMVHPTAAVRDSETPIMAFSPGLRQLMPGTIDPAAAYYNAGVLLLQLHAWRKATIADQALELVKSAGLHDQDALNAVHNGQVHELPQSFNATIHMMRPESPVFGFADGRVIEDARTNPRVVHFTGAIKPWHRNAAMPFLTEWRTVASELGVASFRHAFSSRRRIERWLISKIDSRA